MSTLKVDTIQDTNAVEMYLCKAWVNISGTGTISIRGSGNVSSLTDNGAGAYYVNFTNTMSDTNYSVVGTAGDNTTFTSRNTWCTTFTDSTSRCAVATFDETGGAQDRELISVAVFR